MTTVSHTLGARIYTVRRKKGITSNRLAELCGVGAVHIRKIESGVKLPSIPRFIMICNALAHIHVLANPVLLGEDLLPWG